MEWIEKPNDGSKVFERVLGVTPSGELERHAVGYLEKY